MALEAVWCAVAQRHVLRTIDLEGAITTVICPDYDPARGGCRHRAEVWNNGPLGRLLERVSEKTLDDATAQCVVAWRG